MDHLYLIKKNPEGTKRETHHGPFSWMRRTTEELQMAKVKSKERPANEQVW
jgi:hypothetical protein